MSTERSKYVLLTGGTGYLGKVIRNFLEQDGFTVRTLGRSHGNDYVCDLSLEVPVFRETFDYVVHNGGKAHVVPRSKAEADEFFNVNVQGTRNLLVAINLSPPKSFVFISSIAVYGMTEGIAISEAAPLAAKDPYGKSKIEAEQLIKEWTSQRDVVFASLRLPLVASKNPPGNLGAMIAGIKTGRYFQIEKSRAKKSVVMAEDVARIIPVVALVGGIFNLTDGHHPTFFEIEETIARQLGKDMPRSIPMPVARAMAVAGDVIELLAPGRSPITTLKLKKITSSLTFDDRLARANLNWKPQRVVDAFRI